jgi:rhodanese-related sulfurtransferase
MIDQIRPAQLSEWIRQQDAPAVVLDVREPEELSTASVRPEGFELRTIPMNDVPARVGELDPATPIAVLCHHGARSQRVAQFLESRGFERVVNIAGGIDAWTGERDPSVPRY